MKTLNNIKISLKLSAIIVVIAVLAGVANSALNQLGLPEAAIVVSLVMLCGLSFFAARNFAQPIVRLKNSMIKIAKGDLETTVPSADRGDEIGDMAKVLNRFKRSLAESKDDVRAARFKDTAFEGSSVAIMTVDRDLKVLFVNEATRKLLGENAEAFRAVWPNFDAEKIVGSCIDMFHKNPAHQRQLLSDPSRLPFRTDITVGDFKFALNVSAVFDADQNYIGNCLEWADVTTTRMNAGLMAALDRTQAMIEFTLDGNILNANKNFLDTLGYTIEEIRGRHHAIFVDPDYRQSTEYRAFWEKLNRGEYQEGKFKRVTKAGDEIWIQGSYNAILDDNGKPFKVVKIASDITADEVKRQLSEGVMAALDRTQAMIEFSLDGKIINANKNFLDTLGYTIDEIRGQHHRIFVDADYRQSAEYRALWEKLNRGEYEEGKFKRVAKSGDEIWIQGSYNAIHDCDGKAFKVVKFASDITEEETERLRNITERKAKAAEQTMVVEALANGLKNLADGDLTALLETAFAGEYEQLRGDFNAAVTRLREAMEAIINNAGGIGAGAGEISQAADDLSRRTEQQAATLEETAAAMDQLTASVKAAADGAKKANAAVVDTRQNAEESGEVVREAVAAMSEIEKSSQQISQIIGVIDEIAFQTNLLALNAGVEAARAGDAGRGFAVVASEVRALAQRSSDAAKEIKGLISASSQHVETGVDLVGQAGNALQNIVTRVTEISGLVSDIATSSQEQATGLEEINTAVNQMDQVTQQNAAMVEQSTAASHSLTQEAQELSRLVGHFKTGAQPTAANTQTAPAGKPQPVARQQKRVAAFAGAQGAAALQASPAADADDWQDF